MKIHEHQARNLLEEAGIPVPPAILAGNADEAAAAYERLGADHGATLAVVKAQVHAGGRGKGGGVKLVRSADEARQAADAILSRPLVTPQTGPGGVHVAEVLVAGGVDIDREFYIGIAVDRTAGRPVLIGSAEGGVEIEQVARERPDAIIRIHLDPAVGLQPYQGRLVADHLGLGEAHARAAADLLARLARLFLKLDAALAEINPLVLTTPDADHPEGRLLAIDAKIDFDDNALFRQQAVTDLADARAEVDSEARARAIGLSYIKLDGNIGCLVNGAGLAMATMDLIKLHGGQPANFLDVGGSASEEAVTEAFRIILEDANVQGVLVNIFGGIARCDTIARAIVNAAGLVGFEVPLVVRLEGTNVEEARAILQAAGGKLPTMQIGEDLTDAARKITGAVGG